MWTDRAAMTGPESARQTTPIARSPAKGREVAFTGNQSRTSLKDCPLRSLETGVHRRRLGSGSHLVSPQAAFCYKQPPDPQSCQKPSATPREPN